MNTVTIQVALSEEGLEELDLLVSLSGLSSRTELLNSALTIYRWVANEVMDGGEIAAVYRNRGSFNVMEMSVFENLRKNAKRIKS
ncbi:MAG: hypothetical protein AAB618_01095 [Patescibacteria group bacterium]